MAASSSQSETDSPKQARKMARDERRVNEGFAPKMKRTLGRIPFAHEAVAAYFCARDPGTPTHVKATILGALAYFIMPLDMIPDFIVLLGYTDDAAVFWAAWRMILKHVSDAHRAHARAYLEDL